jgi:acyl-CoA thioester hydrolase
LPKEDFGFVFRLRVRWGECDAQGIVFNAQYMNFIEVAQAEYFRNLGLRLYSEELRNRFDLATVKATFEFMAPARVDDMLNIYTGVSRIGNSSITFNTEMYIANAEQPCARAEVIYANFDADTGVARRIPDDIRETISEFEKMEQPCRAPSPC